MFLKKIQYIIIILLLYQSPSNSKSTSFDNLNYRYLSNYFSGIIAFENKNNSKALDFFNSSKTLMDKHNSYLKKYVYTLVLENKIIQANNLIRQNIDKENSKFLEAYLLLIVDSIKKNDLNKAENYIRSANNFIDQDRFNLAILESLEQYIFVFKQNRIMDNNKNFGKLSTISETLQRCYLGDPKTEIYFSNLVNDINGNFSRYIYFYMSYLIEQNRISDASNLVSDIDYINATLLLAQGKSWIDSGKHYNFGKLFSCKNYKDIVSEFFFIISNLYSSENDFKRSNFYLNLSNYLNPKFIFNLSLVAENQFLNNEFKKTKKIIKNFKKENDFYYRYRVKKEAQIISNQRNKKESLNFITAEFNKIDKPNNKIILDIANFYRNAKEYEKAIEHYSQIIDSLDENSEVKADLLYRRGGSYERLKKYKKADQDLLDSLKINPDDAYVLNYLAYSWLERDYKINEAIKMLETAYKSKNNDPYIIDSIGWAYFLTNDYVKAESFLKRAVELMPDDPIVNDHYGDILWRLDRKIQARYFWKMVQNMDNVDEEVLKKINIKLIEGLKSS